MRKSSRLRPTIFSADSINRAQLTHGIEVHCAPVGSSGPGGVNSGVLRAESPGSGFGLR
jgi:hypothetical protein